MEPQIKVLSPTKSSKSVLEKEFDWLGKLIQHRIAHHFNGHDTLKTINDIPAPKLSLNDSLYAEFIISNNLGLEERAILVISLAPHLSPNFLDDVIQIGLGKAGDFPQLGGVRGKNHRGFLPTGETSLFILAGSDFDERLRVSQFFSEEHFFAKNQVLYLEDQETGEPLMSNKIILSQEILDWLTMGKISRPRFGLNFPAQYIETQMDWEDIVLNVSTEKQLNEIKLWLKHNKELMVDWGMSKKLKPGYRALFYGPPGTGKTITAALLGKYFNREVYKIDLSLMVSKYIGETEKNLAKLFDRANNKDWILFFDEADALFGKRSQVKDAHDRYANQEISYLLQRVEVYNGLVILASNLKENIDDAFMRRFQSKIYFPFPTVEEKLKIWKLGIPKGFVLPNEAQLTSICQKYKLTGAAIMNIIQYCSILSLERGEQKISLDDINSGIKKEFTMESN